jgi:hypothetical protein
MVYRLANHRNTVDRARRQSLASARSRESAPSATSEGSARQEIEYVAELRRLRPVDFRIRAACARDGQESLVLNVEDLREHAARGSKWIDFELTISTLPCTANSCVPSPFLIKRLPLAASNRAAPPRSRGRVTMQPTCIAPRTLTHSARAHCIRPGNTGSPNTRASAHICDRFLMNWENTHFSPRVGGQPVCSVRRFARPSSRVLTKNRPSPR